MTYSTGAEINFIICDHDLLTGVVQLRKSPKFPLIGLLLRHRVGNLDIVLLITLIGHKVNFLRAVVIYLEIIAYIEEFVINDILEVMGEIVSIIHDADGIQGYIFIVNLEIVFQLAFGLGRILLYCCYRIGFFQISDILGDLKVVSFVWTNCWDRYIRPRLAQNECHARGLT